MRLPFGGLSPVQPVEMPNIPDPTPGSGEYGCAIARDLSTRSIEAMPWLPQLPETWAQEIYDRIEAAERSLAAPNLLTGDYIEGTATEPDDIAIIKGTIQLGYLFTAEHATTPLSVKTHEYRDTPDYGTGGLAAVLAEDLGTALVMRGRQTTNVPSVPEHPIKPLIERELATATGFLGVHGKNPGMFVHVDDRAEIHGCIGLGDEPTETMRDFAKMVVLAARDDLGLYIVISNYQPAYIQQPGSMKLKRLENGSPKLSQLAALGPNKTVNLGRRVWRRAAETFPLCNLR